VEVTLIRPAAWVRVPLALLPIESDPASDDRPRYAHPLRWGWGSISRAASAALDAAQALDLDPWTERASVEVDGPRLMSRRYLVEDWLHDGPGLDPATFEVRNGRHRLWGSRAAGRASAPATDDAIDWALASWVAEPGAMSLPTLESVEAWAEDRAWWDSPEARPWRLLNPRHPATLDAVIEAWQVRLTEPSVGSCYR
jgi:hypothetical protein